MLTHHAPSPPPAGCPPTRKRRMTPNSESAIRLRHKCRACRSIRRPHPTGRRVRRRKFMSQSLNSRISSINWWKIAAKARPAACPSYWPHAMDGAAIEIEHPLALRTFCVLRSQRHTELLRKAVGARPVCKNGCMELVQIMKPRSHSFASGRSNLEFAQILSKASGMECPSKPST